MAAAPSTLATATQVATPADFEAALEAAPSPTYAVFFGERDADGQSWCPDCVEADPVISAVLSGREEGSGLLECVVIKAEYARNPSYAYRTHPHVKLTAIPTVIKYAAGAVVAKVEDDACKSEDVLKGILTAK